MLNMNRYMDILAGRFRHGFHFDLGALSLNRYTNGELRGRFTLGLIESSGTGHWPFIFFSYQFLTGQMSAWELTVLGFTVGKRKVHDIDPETGGLNGPDKDQYYKFFMGLNHKHQSMEEIING